MQRTQQDWSKLRVYRLSERKSLTRVEDILIDPASPPSASSEQTLTAIRSCALRITKAKDKGAAIVGIYGAHLLRNGAAKILDRMMTNGWLTHLATNGAGTIHDWEYAWCGKSTENVRENVASGTFGCWDETSRNIHLALMAGALRGDGYGVSLGRFIAESELCLPRVEELRNQILEDPLHNLTGARADLLRAMTQYSIPGGCYRLDHRWNDASILASAFRRGVPVSVHPGIGYDIIANHPMFSGSVIGRAAETDFRLLGDALAQLDGGVVLSIGSAIMGPQVFEKSLSCVNNLRLGAGQSIIAGHTIYVVDLQDGGNWDWTQGEPPKSNPAYYLRFCKSFCRMGGAMQYVQSDNVAFLHTLYHELMKSSSS